MIRDLIKKMRCKHKHLRFSRYLHGDEINWHDGKRWEYRCLNCGAYEYTYHALDCVGCKNLCYHNDGRAACSKNLTHTCILNDYICWTESQCTNT